MRYLVWAILLFTCLQTLDAHVYLNIPKDLQEAGYQCRGSWPMKRSCGWWCGKYQYERRWYGCCSATHPSVYIRNEQICCEDRVYSKRVAGCCNDCVYSKRYSGCCNDEIYKHDSYVCCGNELTEKDGRYMACCGDAAYDTKVYGCCDGKTLYDQETESCCWGNVYNRTTQKCCGGESIYDVALQGCCHDRLVYNLTTEGCCGDVTYSTESSYCCTRPDKSVERHHYPSCDDDGSFVSTCYCDKYFSCKKGLRSLEDCPLYTVYDPEKGCVVADAEALRNLCYDMDIQPTQTCGDMVYVGVNMGIYANRQQTNESSIVFQYVGLVPAGPLFLTLAYISALNDESTLSMTAEVTNDDDGYNITSINGIGGDVGFKWHAYAGRRKISLGRTIVAHDGVTNFIISYVKLIDFEVE